METQVIEDNQLKSDTKSDLRGHLEAAMASEITKIDVRSNIHMDTSVIKIAGFKSEVKLDL